MLYIRFLAKELHAECYLQAKSEIGKKKVKFLLLVSLWLCLSLFHQLENCPFIPWLCLLSSRRCFFLVFSWKQRSNCIAKISSLPFSGLSVCHWWIDGQEYCKCQCEHGWGLGFPSFSSDFFSADRWAESLCSVLAFQQCWLLWWQW